jgi:hypothetical protein
VITKAGTVISGLNITGTVIVEANNVTIENCSIANHGWAVVTIASGVTGAVVQDCTLNGLGSAPDGTGNQGIMGQGTFLRNNISNVENGITVEGNNTVIEGNYIHDLNAGGSPHYDNIQIDGGLSNIKISNNTLINLHGSTSAVMVDNDFGAISNVSVDSNLLVGGAYTVYSDSNGGSAPITGVSFTNNHIGGGQYGDALIRGNNAAFTGNVDDGVALAAKLNTSANTGSGTPTPPPTQPALGSSAPLSAPKIVSYSQDSGVAGDGITNDSTLTLTGTAAANSTVKVFDGSTQVGTTTANSSGSWSDILAVLTDAKHTLTAIATDSAGQTSSASSALTVTVDTHAPAAPILVSDSVVNTNHALVSGTAEASSSIAVYDGTTVVGTATAGTNGTWSVTTGALATGSQVLTATTTDAAGNTSAHSQALDPVIGSPAPTSPPPSGSPPSASPPSAPKLVSFSNDSGVVGDHITNDSILTLSGTAAVNSTVTVFDGMTKLGTATANSSGAWSYTTPTLGDGGHNLTATDSTSGHTSSVSSPLAVTIDTHAPVVSTMAVFSQGGTAVTGTTTADDLLLKGTAEANSSVHVFDGAKQIGTAATNGSGLWSFDTGHLADGSHSFTSTAIDVAGNASAASVVKGVTVDAPASAVAVTHLHESSSDIVTITGTADADSQIKISDGTKVVATEHAAANGTWSFTSSAPVSNTVHTYTAQELDSTGHVVTSSGSAILGSTGRDMLTSTAGNDVFVGHGQADSFVFAPNFGKDVINDFRAGGTGHDVVQFSKSVFDNFADVLAHATQSGHNVVIADTAGDSLTLKNVKLGALDKNDFHFA